MVTIRVISFKGKGKGVGVDGHIINQFKVAPPKMAPVVKSIIGVVKNIGSSFKEFNGLIEGDAHSRLIINRAVYAEVKDVAINTNIRVTIEIGENKYISNSISLE